MEFGRILRKLRKKAGLGIKRLAPKLDVNYTFLSRLENNDVGPSEAFIRRVANYFDYDNDLLLLAAGKVPADIRNILQKHPEEALKLLRVHFSSKKKRVYR